MYKHEGIVLTMSQTIAQTIAQELVVKPTQVEAAIALLDEGATVPFVARYRKEVTGGLDDTQLRLLEQRLQYLREMEERRDTILNSIKDQGKLSEELNKAILEAETKTRLEDLYLPFKPKRRTKGQIAIEAGLEPLADALFRDPTLSPIEEAQKNLNEELGFADSKSVLEGAKYILMERFAEDADLLQKIRELLLTKSVLKSAVAKGKESEAAKFKDYFDYEEKYSEIPSHRALALFRGRKEGLLMLGLEVEQADNDQQHPVEQIISVHLGVKNQGRAADDWLAQVVQWTGKIKIIPSLELELMGSLREKAEEEAIKVFAANLKDLLLAAPAGPRATIGLDPGFRTGTKVAVIDKTGKLLDYATIYPHAPQKQWDQSIAVLADLATKHQVEVLSIGNGTASRETDALAADLIKKYPQLKLTKIVVNEAGASVYSASEFAAKEFPQLDVTIRGAVSIARRLQDPLAELVKIEPKSIGVGQYQHDVNQVKLSRSLDAAVEDCVNEVGVDVNTASAALLKRVSGLNETLASNIVSYRDQNGAFSNRDSIKSVERFGEKTFEQAAGFLRIMSGDNPLDASSVHPESYAVVEKIIERCKLPIEELIGKREILRSLNASELADEQFGVPTITDILAELEKPGRDPRPEFKMAKLQDGVEKMSDLKVGMLLEGTVTNVANFGAFVDIGVHQDGLVHISAIADKFVKDPREVVKVGQIVKVKVVEVEIDRKRIGLSMRLTDEPDMSHKTKPKQQERASNQSVKQGKNGRSANQSNKTGSQPKIVNTIMADKLAALLKK